VQNFLYKRALFGLDVYKKREIREMHPKERSKIARIHRRTQRELNSFKQQLVIQKSNVLLSVFHKSPLAQKILQESDTIPDLDNKFSFGDLGIKKEHVVERLHQAGILPSNFYEINAR
jgi:hypothetical protein